MLSALLSFECRHDFFREMPHAFERRDWLNDEMRHSGILPFSNPVDAILCRSPQVFVQDVLRCRRNSEAVLPFERIQLAPLRDVLLRKPCQANSRNGNRNFTASTPLHVLRPLSNGLGGLRVD